MMMSAVFTRESDPDAQEFWTHLKGWRRYFQLKAPSTSRSATAKG